MEFTMFMVAKTTAGGSRQVGMLPSAVLCSGSSRRDAMLAWLSSGAGFWRVFTSSEIKVVGFGIRERRVGGCVWNRRVATFFLREREMQFLEEWHSFIQAQARQSDEERKPRHQDPHPMEATLHGSEWHGLWRIQ